MIIVCNYSQVYWILEFISTFNFAKFVSSASCIIWILLYPSENHYVSFLSRITKISSKFFRCCFRSAAAKPIGKRALMPDCDARGTRHMTSYFAISDCPETWMGLNLLSPLEMNGIWARHSWFRSQPTPTWSIEKKQSTPASTMYWPSRSISKISMRYCRKPFAAFDLEANGLKIAASRFLASVKAEWKTVYGIDCSDASNALIFGSGFQ